MALTKAQRDALPADAFAVPGKRLIPLHDADHVKLGWMAVAQAQGLSHEDRRLARNRVLAAAKSFSVDTSRWEAQMSAGTQRWGVIDFVSAMSLNISSEAHPNKMPFSGVLTKIGTPSDSPPHGSNGRLVLLTAEAAHAALPSLLGMAVNYRPSFDGHAAQDKVGIITGANIQGNEILIEGFIYAADFPEAAEMIQAMKDHLGFSFEAKQILVKDLDADILEISSMAFTGAAILRKDKAAYLGTSLAAEADDDNEENDMTPEQAAALKLVADALPGLVTTVNDLKSKVEAGSALQIEAAKTSQIVEPMAKGLEKMASDLEAAGIGSHPTRGHAAYLRQMAATMRAAGAMGTLPSTFDAYFAAAPAGAEAGADAIKTAVEAALKPLQDKLAAQGTELADLKAAAAQKGPNGGGNSPTPPAPTPQRKSADAGIQASASQALTRLGLQAPDEGKQLTVTEVDAAMKTAGLDMNARLALKTSLSRAGLMAA